MHISTIACMSIRASCVSPVMVRLVKWIKLHKSIHSQWEPASTAIGTHSKNFLISRMLKKAPNIAGHATGRIMEMERKIYSRKKFFVLGALATAGVFIVSRFSFTKKLFNQRNEIKVSINPMAVKRSRGRSNA